MNVLPTDTSFDVKEQIHQRMEDRDNGSGLVPDLQHLLAIMGQFPTRLRKVCLSMDHLTLSDYGIQHGDTVEVDWNDDEVESYYTSDCMSAPSEDGCKAAARGAATINRLDGTTDTRPQATSSGSQKHRSTCS